MKTKHRQIITLAALTVALLAGCATQPIKVPAGSGWVIQTPFVDQYGYENIETKLGDGPATFRTYPIHEGSVSVISSEVVR